MSIIPYEAIILDIDGTLVKPDINWRYVRRRLAEMGITVGNEPVAEAISKLFERNRELASMAEREVHEFEKKSIEGIKRDEELIELLQGIKRMGIKVAVVTLRSRDTAYEVLKRLGILGLVNTLIARDDSHSRVEQLVLAIKRLNVSKERVLFIGDTLFDLKAGRSLGINVLLVDSKGDEVNSVPKMLKKVLRDIVKSPLNK